MGMSDKRRAELVFVTAMAWEEAGKPEDIGTFSMQAAYGLGGLVAHGCVRRVLVDHYVTAIECDHETKTDVVRCSCSVWTGTAQQNVGAAVLEWVEHVCAIVREMEQSSSLLEIGGVHDGGSIIRV